MNQKRVPIEQFQVGVNYSTGNRYGYNAGLYPFGGRDFCGFSTNRQKLLRDFRSLAEHGVDLVRIFLLDDLRSGVLLDRNGRAAGSTSASVPTFVHWLTPRLPQGSGSSWS